MFRAMREAVEYIAYTVYFALFTVSGVQNQRIPYTNRAQTMGFPWFFAMCQVFIENRIFGRLLFKKDTLKEPSENVFRGEWITFERWIGLIRKKSTLWSIKKSRMFADWPEIHHFSRNRSKYRFWVDFLVFLICVTFFSKIESSDGCYSKNIHWKNHRRTFFEGNE